MKSTIKSHVLLATIAVAVVLFAVPPTNGSAADDPPEAAKNADAATDDEPKDDSSDATAEKTLDEQLLKELDDELFEDLDDALFEGLSDDEEDRLGGPEGAPAEDPAERALDEELLRGLDPQESEMIDDNPLARIGRQMRRAEALIGEGSTGDETQTIQRDTISQLDELIKAARRRKQQQSQQSSKASKQASQRSKQKQPGAAPGEGDGGQQEGPARDSSNRLGKQDVRKIDREAMNSLLKDIWGHLPDKVREQMLQSSMDQFLPEYSLMIEEYFKRLVEDRTDLR